MELYTVTLTHHGDPHYDERSMIQTVCVNSEVDLTKVPDEILYRAFFRTYDDDFNIDEHSLKTEKAEILTFTEDKRDSIMEDFYLEAMEVIADDLDLEYGTEEWNKASTWLHEAELSMEEIVASWLLTRRYEEYIVANTPKEDLPLLVGRLKSEDGIKKLESRLKGDY